MNLSFVEILLLLLVVAGATKAAALFAAEASNYTLAQRRGIAFKSVAIQAVVLYVFALAGPAIMDFFHVSVAALEVAGGLILLIFAIQLVLGDGGDHGDGAHSGDISIYPMAVPLMASPQAIVATVIITTQLGVGHRWPLHGALAALLAFNLIVLLAIAQFVGAKGEPDATKSGGGAAQVLLRIIALLLAALAVEIIALGLRGYGVLGPMPGGAAH